MRRDTKVPSLSKRLLFARVFFCLIFSLLSLRLYYLQGIKGSYYRDLSENNRLRTIRREAARGLIFDRNGKVLVRNRPSYDIAILKEDTPDIKATLRALSTMLDSSEEDMQRQLHKAQTRQPFQPLVVLPDVSREAVARVKVNSSLLPGVIVQTRPARAYPFGSLATQSLGFTREISSEQLAKRKKLYRAGDTIGQSGLESTYESQLRGSAGYVQVEVDARGARRGEVEIVEEGQGNSLYLTIDSEIQKEAEDALAGRRGALVALDPNNGEVLALASSPSFDANTLAGRVSRDDWRALTSDKNKPLRNRAISSIYPPGSTLKLVYAAAGLSEGVISKNTKINCPGFYRLGRGRYRCHKHSGHGIVDLKRAIRVSCNVYFYHLGQVLGVERISRYLNMFGFGNRSGVDLPKEEAGVRPSEEWKEKRVGEKWYPGDTIPVSIGQGYLVVTPLQLARAISVVANGGTLYEPHIVSKIVSPTGELIEEPPTKVERKLPIAPEIFAQIRAAGAEVVNHRKGTGQRARLVSVPVGGKTGTAQVSKGVGEKENELLMDHALFVAFAPVDKPSIVVATLVENAGGGGRNAAPVARKVLRKFFRARGVLSDEDWQIVDTGPDGVIPPLVARTR